MDWSPFVVCAPEEYAPSARGMGGPEGLGDRLRTAAFAERQAFAAFVWAADAFTDASDELRAAWRRIGAEEKVHLDLLLARMAELGPPAEADLALLYEFLGVAQAGSAPSALSPKARHTRLLNVVRELVKHDAATTSVILIEDLHWLDEASEEFVATLVEAAAGTQTMVVLNFRPSYRLPWAQFENFEKIDLGQLSLRETEHLVRALIGPRSELQDICELVATRSGGNPFFAEELVRSLVDRGYFLEGSDLRAGGLEAIERALPATVQAVIGARLDRLGEPEKTLLQMCAIIGKEIRANSG